jgi:hypothetical protein
MARYSFSLLLLMLLCGTGCALTHPGAYHRVGKVEYVAKSKETPIEICEDLVDYPYDVIATVDSRAVPDVKAAKAQLLEDLKLNARLVGADAVHRIRRIEVHGHGKMLDNQNPIPGAWKQAYYTHYILRGEAIRKKEDKTDEK